MKNIFKAYFKPIQNTPQEFIFTSESDLPPNFLKKIEDLETIIDISEDI